MAQKNAANGRTDTKRFADDVEAAELIEGDRISPLLVARNIGQLGDKIVRQPPESENESPPTQLVAITAINSMDDVHSALLADPETGTIVRAGRHDKSQAMNQKEADWTVRDVGTHIAIDEVHELSVAESDDPVEDEQGYAQQWAEIVIEDSAAGHTDYSDEREMNGPTLMLSDHDCRKLVATITLE